MVNEWLTPGSLRHDLAEQARASECRRPRRRIFGSISRASGIRLSFGKTSGEFMSRTLLLAAVAGLLGVYAAQAQSYPSRPITMVVGFSAGGPTDTVARLIGERMGRSLGQTIVIENTTGA